MSNPDSKAVRASLSHVQQLGKVVRMQPFGSIKAQYDRRFDEINRRGSKVEERCHYVFGGCLHDSVS